MLKIRNIKRCEIEQVMRVENETWEEGTRASIDKFISRFDIFPIGIFGVYENNKLIGVSTSEIIKSLDISSWEQATDNGYIVASHDSNGKHLYVVSVGVSKYYRGKGAGSLLINAQKKLIEQLNLESLVLGARVPGFSKSKLNIEEYVKIDSEIKFYEKNGLSVSEIKSNYMEDDKESKNYGVLMQYKIRKLKD